jgi:serine/threonine protein phosphatase 1
MNNSSPIRQLPANRLGKDYVVGDLHGCFNLLERLLEAVSFDVTRDRLFSVGDLIDRGPDSLRCLQLLEEPWFFAAQGNHERMMLNFFLSYLDDGKLDRFDDDTNTGFLDYGGDWVHQYFYPNRQGMSEAFDRCLPMVLAMPLVWVVGEGTDRFHVIHGDLVRPNGRFSDPVVWLDSDLDQWIEKSTILSDIADQLYWGRTLMLRGPRDLDYGKIQQGLSTTFCGHTLATRPRQVLSHLCLDTGAYVSLDTFGSVSGYYGLTLFDVHVSRWLFASYGQHQGIREEIWPAT